MYQERTLHAGSMVGMSKSRVEMFETDWIEYLCTRPELVPTPIMQYNTGADFSLMLAPHTLPELFLCVLLCLVSQLGCFVTLLLQNFRNLSNGIL